MENVGETFVFEPCSADCRYYNYVIDEMTRQGKPLFPMVDPDVGAKDARRFLRDIERRVRVARAGRDD